MSSNIKTAVLPVGGWGTRVLPATVAVPKPLLPVFDTPAIQLTVEEAVKAGINRIILVTTDNLKGRIEEHFAPSRELVNLLGRKGKLAVLEGLLRLSNQVEIEVVTQNKALGLGHAVYCAAEKVGNSPFVVMLPDDLVDPSTPCLPGMIAAFESQQDCGSVLSLFEVPAEQISSFGIVAGEWINRTAGVFAVSDMVEKPEAVHAPSNLAIAGRYVLSPDIFPILKRTRPGKGGEIQITDALKQLALQGRCYGTRLEGQRYDIGSPMGLLTTSIAYALRDPKQAAEIRNFLRTTIL